MDLPNLTDMSYLLDVIPDVVRNPAANPRAAMLVFAMAALVVLIVLAGVVTLVIGRDEEQLEGEEERAERPEGLAEFGEPDEPGEPVAVAVRAKAEQAEHDDAAGTVTDVALEPLPAPVYERVRARLSVWTSVSLVVITTVLVWSLTGAATIDRSWCLACHPDNPHAGSTAIDPHAEVACVACHEHGNLIALVFFTVPDRFYHFASGEFGRSTASVYGRPISSFECRRCHSEVLDTVIFADATKVRMSHAEPLEAGAECIDCHALQSGVVSSHNTGMAPCMRCHDDEAASADCQACHVGDVALALRPADPASGVFTKAQIDQPQCDGCHDQAAQGCDSCHGIRLPHTRQFMQYGHAREGVEDIWNNGGRKCGRCHDERRPCSSCHDRFPSHGLSWRTEHYATGIGFERGCACHEDKAYVQGRNYCALCHERAR